VAKGIGKVGKSCFRFSIQSPTLNESGTMLYGDIRLFPLGEGQSARVSIQPERGFDFGAGPGKPIEREVRGGSVGLILDARGRPLDVSVDRTVSRKTVDQWVTAMGVYPEVSAATR
jgi:hypothetical protein